MSAPPARPECSRDPPRVAAHHLDDHHPVVALGGGVQPVDRVGRDLHRGVEPEREVGRRQVVVDRLGHADDVARPRRRASPRRRACPRRRSRSARRRARAAACRGPGRRRRRSCTDSSRLDPRIVPPRGSSPRVDAVVSVDRLALDHAAPAVAEADDVVAVDALRPCARRRGSPRSGPGSRRRRSACRCAWRLLRSCPIPRRAPSCRSAPRARIASGP